MTRAELESKHLAELHALADKASVPRYRMLSRGELIEALLEGEGEPKPAARREPSRRRREERPRERREPSRREPRGRPAPRSKPAPTTESSAQEPTAAPQPAPASPPGTRPKRRRRRRFRRRKSVRVHDLLLPPASGRQAIVHAETRAGCTALLRELAAELCQAKGPDPVALLIDPSPEELADWKREAPAAEIVSAGQERHADDALAQAARRAGEGEDVFLLIDSLSRLAEAFGADSAKDLFDAGQGLAPGGGGSLTIVAALERQ